MKLLRKHKYIKISVLEKVLLENEKTFDGKKYLDETIISLQNNMDSKQSDYALEEYTTQKKELGQFQQDRALLNQEISDETITAYLCNKATEEENEMILDRAGYDPSFLRELCDMTSMIISDFDEQVKHERRKERLRWGLMFMLIILDIISIIMVWGTFIDEELFKSFINGLIQTKPSI